MKRLLSTVSSHTIQSTRPLSLTSPFTRSTLNSIRKTLENTYPEQDIPYDPSEPHAAVLVPFCNVNSRPGILLEVRGKLRTHSGEVRYAGGVTFMLYVSLMRSLTYSFPGGRVDEVSGSENRRALLGPNSDADDYSLLQTDETTLATALRETQEEVGIEPDQVEILGRFGPPERSLGGMRVWPYVVCQTEVCYVT